MEPVFLDFHIHTSSNFEVPNDDYDVSALKSGIERIADGSPYLISISDHNFVNKAIYLQANREFENLLLGVELHIRNYKECKPYHCHIVFNVEDINEEVIDSVNEILDDLYPKKTVCNDDDIPNLETILKAFDSFEFLLLPHGGQNHSTFDKSIPEGVTFDKTLERSIYYNHFDGFTARGTKGLKKTQDYFERLGIKDFVNLVTATDNYTPENYPDCKAGRSASDFVPTWMLAAPTFSGLRLSLSESLRLVYGEKPDSWTEYIRGVYLHEPNITIDVRLTPGLNVIIGGSSTGKSLLVDAVFHEIAGELDECQYINSPYDISGINVDNPSGQQPHYFNQNYIMRICDQKDKNNTIDDISILKSVFPPDEVERAKIQNALKDLRAHLAVLVESVTEIEVLQDALSRIPNLASLIVTEQIQDNPLRKILPTDRQTESIFYSEADYEEHIGVLREIDGFLTKNPLIEHDGNLTEQLEAELVEAIDASTLDEVVRETIFDHKLALDEAQEAESEEMIRKSRDFQGLLDGIRAYIRHQTRFFDSLDKISSFSISISTKEIKSMGHSLSIKNEFELSKDKFLEVVNEALPIPNQIAKFDQITPESLFKKNFKRREPKIVTYPQFENFVIGRFAEMNHKTFKIVTSDGRDFDQLSAGWKTSVILDLVLGWDSDRAPLIIDQPEDNLATGYINAGLLDAIKKTKTKKQIILVSHNATIPMLGDAQNVVSCTNDSGNISITASPLEGEIDGRSVVDLIAEVTDGGKSSIKKRVKKYNLKDFREAT